MKKKQVPTKEIREKLKIAKGTIYWHTNPEFRQRMREYQKKKYHQLTKEQKKKILDRKRDYQREYFKRRYNNEEEFRKKHLKRVKLKKGKK